MNTARACCLAMNADCLSCSAGMDVEDYCNQNPSTYGCKGGKHFSDALLVAFQVLRHLK